jgi:hypothetical protein
MSVLEELQAIVASLPVHRETDGNGVVVAERIDRGRVLEAISAFEEQHPGLVDDSANCDVCGAVFADKSVLRRDYLRKMNVCPACARDASH